MSQERASTITRRNALMKTMGLAAAVGASWAALRSASADSGNKAPQQAVQYQDKPKGDNKCAACDRFRSPDGCALVQGPISPDGWCRLFVKKAG